MGKKVKDNRRTTIYVLIDPFTEEIRYVGKTVKPLRERLSGHLYSIKRERNHKTRWIEGLLRQGRIPKIESIDHCDWQTSQELEIFWISYFRENGCRLVNTTDGGEGNLGGKRSVEAITKLKHTLNLKARNVFQYTLQGEFLKEYGSVAIAAESINGRYSNIFQCCNLRKKSHKGFIWSYLPPESIDISLYGHKERTIKVTLNNSFIKRSRKVLITDLVTGMKVVVGSLKEASDLTGVSKPSICCECKGQRKTKGNFKFEYHECT